LRESIFLTKIPLGARWCLIWNFQAKPARPTRLWALWATRGSQALKSHISRNSIFRITGSVPPEALVVMKVAGDPHGYENAVRKIVAGVDKDTPVFRYRMFTDDIRNQAAQPRFQAMLVSGFALIALVLAAVGLYSVLSYVVAERRRELGLRMALGASRRNVVQLVLQRGLLLACIGIAAGAAGSVFATRLIADLLFKVKPLDGPIFVLVAFVLLMVSVLAALMPAMRAAKVSPMEALRAE
jgi:ABC-type antimicrobial peptide transport system permease subunit